MNTNMQDPVGMERNSMGKDTGFPEPLSLGMFDLPFLSFCGWEATHDDVR